METAQGVPKLDFVNSAFATSRFLKRALHVSLPKESRVLGASRLSGSTGYGSIRGDTLPDLTHDFTCTGFIFREDEELACSVLSMGPKTDEVFLQRELDYRGGVFGALRPDFDGGILWMPFPKIRIASHCFIGC